MATPTIIEIHAAKGGQGATVTAVMLAVLYAAAGKHVTLVGDVSELCTVLGEPYGESGVDGLRVVNPDSPFAAGTDVVVVDVSSSSPAVPRPVDDVRRVLVVRNGYLEVRAAARWTFDRGNPDAVVLQAEAGRALHTADVEAALGMRAVTVTVDQALARTIDAGLLVARRDSLTIAKVGRVLADMLVTA